MNASPHHLVAIIHFQSLTWWWDQKKKERKSTNKTQRQSISSLLPCLSASLHLYGLASHFRWLCFSLFQSSFFLFCYLFGGSCFIRWIDRCDISVTRNFYLTLKTPALRIVDLKREDDRTVSLWDKSIIELNAFVYSGKSSLSTVKWWSLSIYNERPIQLYDQLTADISFLFCVELFMVIWLNTNQAFGLWPKLHRFLFRLHLTGSIHQMIPEKCLKVPIWYQKWYQYVTRMLWDSFEIFGTGEGGWVGGGEKLVSRRSCQKWSRRD